MLGRLGAGDWCRYWTRLQQLRTSPREVFSFKVFLSDLNQMANICPDLQSLVHWDDTIFLTRRRKLDQAISWVRAARTRGWFDVEGVAQPAYDERSIVEALDRIEREEAAWEGFFRDTGSTPERIIYEDLVHDRTGQVRRALEAVCLPMDVEPTTLRVSLTRLADEATAVWKRRFLRETRPSREELRRWGE